MSADGVNTTDYSVHGTVEKRLAAVCELDRFATTVLRAGTCFNRNMIFTLATLAALTVSNRIPMFATIAGISVGLTDIPRAERKLGPGQFRIGGHSGGARSWYDRKHGVQLYVDGFYYHRRAEVVDTIDLSWPGGPSTASSWPGGKSGPEPVIALPSNAYGFWSKIRKGMSQYQFLAAIPVGAYKLFRSVDRIVLVSAGLSQFNRRLSNKDNDRFEVWRADVGFQNGFLDSILITAT